MYYYAGGERISIEPDDAQVAVDPTKAMEADLRSAVERAARGTHLPGGILLLPRSALDEPWLQRLRESGALRTVYRRGQVLIIPLPEIRVEFDDPEQRQAVVDSIPQAPYPVKVAEKHADRMLLMPVSGNSEEALAIANFVYEHARPASAAVRFLQVVPKRQPRR